MAWVRRVRTASGATAVQIAESVAGRRRIVRHVGSARDEAELGLLIEEAHRLLADDRQGVLDLGITPAVSKAVMLPPSSQPAPRQPCSPTPGTVPAIAAAGVAAAGAQDVLRAAVRRSGWGVRESRVRCRGRRGLPRPGDRARGRADQPARRRPGPGRDGPRISEPARPANAPCAVLKRRPTATRSRRPASTTPWPAATSAWCSTTSPRSTSRQRRKTTSARSATPRNAASTRRSWSGCWSTGRVPARDRLLTRATRPRRQTIVPIVKQFQERHGLADMVVVADAGMLSAANLKELDEAGLAVHRRLPGHQGARSIWRPTSAGTATRSPTARSSTPSPRRTSRGASRTTTRS